MNILVTKKREENYHKGPWGNYVQDGDYYYYFYCFL